MTKQDVLRAVRKSKATDGKKVRIENWVIWVEKTLNRYHPGPAWWWLIYAHRDHEQYKIGGWVYATEAARIIIRENNAAKKKMILTKSGYCHCETCAECFLTPDNEYDKEEVAEVLYGDDCMGLTCDNCGKKSDE